MLFLIPVAALAVAAVLLFPLRRGGVAPYVKKRILANAGVFLLSAVLLVTLAIGAGAQNGPDADATQPVMEQQIQQGAPAPEGTADGTVSTQMPAVPASDNGRGLGFLAAALATGLSCLGAGIAIASTAPAAIGAFSEDPKAFGKALIFVVLGEGVALYGLLISILLINKL